MNWKTILVPTDFSPSSDSALRLATSLARDGGARLLIVHVAEPRPAYTVAGIYASLPSGNEFEAENEQLRHVAAGPRNQVRAALPGGQPRGRDREVCGRRGRRHDRHGDAWPHRSCALVAGKRRRSHPPPRPMPGPHHKNDALINRLSHPWRQNMFDRREFLLTVGAGLAAASVTQRPFAEDRVPPFRKKLAIVTTEWRYKSHAWHMAERFLGGYPIAGRWHRPPFDVVAAYVDQKPENDLSRDRRGSSGSRFTRPSPRRCGAGARSWRSTECY